MANGLFGMMTPADLLAQQQQQLAQQGSNLANAPRGRGSLLYAPQMANLQQQGIGGLFGLDLETPEMKRAKQAEQAAAAVQGQVGTPEYYDGLARELQSRGLNQAALEAAELARRLRQQAEESQRAQQRLDQQAEQRQRDLSVADTKAIREATGAAQVARGKARQLSSLAQQYITERPTGGVLGNAFSAFKDFIGGQDEISSLRTQATQLLTSAALDNLPPGAASDGDVRLALRGFPNANWNAEELGRYLAGLAKLEAFNAEYQDFLAKWISDNKGDTSGVNEAFAEYAKTIKDRYFDTTATAAATEGGEGDGAVDFNTWRQQQQGGSGAIPQGQGATSFPAPPSAPIRGNVIGGRSNAARNR